MPLAYWCVLIAALLPYVLGKYAKYGVESDNRYPREDYDNLPPKNRRPRRRIRRRSKRSRSSQGLGWCARSQGRRRYIR